MAEEQQRRDEAQRLQEEKEAQERAKAEQEENLRLQKQVYSLLSPSMQRKHLKWKLLVRLGVNVVQWTGLVSQIRRKGTMAVTKNIKHQVTVITAF